MSLTRREIEEARLGGMVKCLEKPTDSKTAVIGTCQGECIYQLNYLDPEDETNTVEKPSSVNAYFNGDDVAQAVADGLVGPTFQSDMIKFFESKRLGQQ